MAWIHTLSFYAGFMVFKGSSDFKDVELFNGERNLYLKVKEEEIEGHRSNYKVKVAKRPLVSIKIALLCLKIEISNAC